MLALGRRLAARTLALLLFVILAGELGSSRPTTETIRVEAKMDDAMAQLWYDMPQSSMSQNVELSGNTQPDCADAALRKARMALTQVGIRDAARRAAVQTVDIAKDIFEHAFGIGWAGMLGDAIGLYLESGSVDELADNLKKLAAEKAGQAVAKGASAGAGAIGGKTTGAASTAAGAVSGGLEGYPAEKGAGELAKYLWDQMNKAGDSKLFESTYEDPQCGTIAVTFEMKVAPNGRRSIHFRASGDCGCKWPERVPQPMRLGRWTVIGNGDLAPQTPRVNGTTIVIPYHLSNTHYIVSATCGCPEGGDQSYTDPGTGTGTGTVPDTPKVPVYERICWQRCGDLWSKWQELQREADRLASAVQSMESQLPAKQRELAQDEQNLQQAQTRLNAANEHLGKYNTARLQSLFHNQYVEAKRNQERATEEVSRLTNRVNRQRQELDELQQSLQRMRDMANRRAAEAAAARDAYYRCAESCYQNAIQSGELNALPDDVQEWKRTQPKSTEQASSAQPTENMLIGVVVGSDTRTGEKTTARVVPNPKSFQNIPGLRVIELTTRVAIGKDGKADVDKLQARIGDGPAQSCDKPVTGTVRGDKLKVSVGQPGGATATGEIPVTPGQPRTAPVNVRPGQFRTPAMMQRGTVGVVHGPFDGRNLGTSVMVGGRPAEILAETGQALYFVVPGDLQPGQTGVMVEEQGVRMKFKVATVGLQMAAGQLQLEKGQSASFTATVTGADKLPQSAWQAGDPGEFSDLVDMEQMRRMAPKFRPPAKGAPGMVLLLLENLSPQVVSMSGGNAVQQELGQGSFAGGPYTYNGSVTAGQKGSFSIKGQVIPFLAPVTGEYSK
jgi:hypothetical protein